MSGGLQASECTSGPHRDTAELILIPRDAWVSAFEEFTRTHEGWIVSLEVVNTSNECRHAFENVSLLGISADRLAHTAAIAISVARARTDHFTHIVPSATAVSLERTAESAEAALHIESSDGSRTILRFHSAAVPKTADGVVAT